MCLLLLFSSLLCCWIPAIAQREYAEGEWIDLSVSKLDSAMTQLSYDYYYLNFCKPKYTQMRAGNIGEILSGARIENSLYNLSMNYNYTCAALCHKKNTRGDQEDFRWMIDNDYNAHWIADDLPAGLRLSSFYVEGRVNYYMDGIPIGIKQAGEYFIYNHVNIILQVFEVPYGQGSKYRITGFLVEPFSFEQDESNLACNTNEFKSFLKSAERHREIDLHSDEYINKIIFNPAFTRPQCLNDETTYSYSVIFEKTQIPWARRWDKYLYMSTDSTEVHWLSIINSFTIMLFMSGMIACILVKNLRRSNWNYSRITEFDLENGLESMEIEEEVFREPLYSELFGIIVAAGGQLIATCFILFLIACLGFLSSADRGGLLTAFLDIFALSGFLAGYLSARFFKTFGGVNWKMNAVRTALLFPGICFSVFFMINLLLWAEKSSRAVLFFDILSLVLLWLGISVPLVFLGYEFGKRQSPIVELSKLGSAPELLVIPLKVSRVKAVCLIAGSLPFGCIFLELRYIMISIWHHTTFYNLFGFVFLSFVILIITSAEISILVAHILFRKQDYRWWWISFAVSGSSGLYFFAYSVIYNIYDLEITRLSGNIFYFGYMFLASLAFGLITGSAGFLAAFKFIRVIYA